MLQVIFADRDTLVQKYGMMVHNDIYFDNFFEWSWLDEDWVRRELVEVEHMDEGVHPKEVMVLRGQPYCNLCGGTKTLLLARNMDEVLDFCRMGPNCYKYLMEISDIKDITFGVASALPGFDDEAIKGRPIKVLNTGEIVHTSSGFWKVGLSIV